MSDDLGTAPSSSKQLHKAPSTLKRAFFGDTDDELTDLSDAGSDEEEEGEDEEGEGEEGDEGGGEEAAYGGDEPAPSDGEKDNRPARKRVKTASGARGEGGKVRAGAGKGKGKGKETKGKAAKGKGKGKAKAQKEKKLPKVDPVDGRLIARRPEWNDIPDWRGKKESPLMQMPAEVMDRCFGLGQSLDLRDYIALAGVCRYFRQFLDNDFFHHLWHDRGQAGTRYDSSPPKHKLIKGENGETVRVPNLPDNPPGYAPFSRTVSDIYVKAPTPAIARVRGKNGEYRFYVPSGPRESWSREQYTVYTEEKRKWAVRAITDIKKANKEAALEAEEARGKRGNRKTTRIRFGNTMRTVFAVIEGRLDGEKAIEKDDTGLPVVQSEVSDMAPRSNPDTDNASEDEEEDDNEESAAIAHTFELRELTQKKKVRKATSAKVWIVPKDDKNDENVVELRGLSLDKYDDNGNKMVHDHWPAKFREYVANEVNGTFMNLTESMKKQGLSKAELISLRHYLTTNPMSTVTPQQVFNQAAVEALALRAHGGEAGHREFMAQKKSRSDKLAATRAEKERIAEEEALEAERNGIYVEPARRRKKLSLPVWEYRYRWAVCRWIRSGIESCGCCYCCEELGLGCCGPHW